MHRLQRVVQGHVAPSQATSSNASTAATHVLVSYFLVLALAQITLRNAKIKLNFQKQERQERQDDMKTSSTLQIPMGFKMPFTTYTPPIPSIQNIVATVDLGTCHVLRHN